MTRYPAIAACLLLIFGIMMGTTLHPSDFVMFCIVILFFILGLIGLYRRSKILMFTAAACCLVLLGIFGYNLLATNFPPNHISWFNDLPHEMTVTGQIVREPDLRPDKTLLTIKCDTLSMMNLPVPVSGLLMVRINRFDDRFNYADRVRITGYVRTPIERRNFHGFDYRRYLMLKRINSYVSVKHGDNVCLIESGAGNRLISGLIIPLRKYILHVFEKHISGSERSLIAGFLIGETRFIPQQIYEHFRDTGTLHLLAVSGSNVVLVVGTVMFLFRFAGAPRKIIQMLSLVVIVIFCQLSFNQPSVVRASLMIGLVIIGQLVYRRGNLLNVIAVAALLILLYDPMMLYDVGFQLSFAAAFSLIYFLKGFIPKQRRYPRWKRWLSNFSWMVVLSSIIVQLMVAPILAYYFGTIPLITFVSNLLVIPVSSAAVILSMLLILFAPVPYLSGMIAIVAQFFLFASIKLVDWFASMPVVKLNMAAPDLIHIVFYYATLFTVFAAFKKRQYLKFLVILLLIWSNIYVWQKVADGFDRAPTATILDLGRQAGLHLHIPPDYDMVMTNAGQQGGFDQIDRVIKPYLMGESITDLDRWEVCAPTNSTDRSLLERSNPVPIDSTPELPHHAKPEGQSNAGSVDLFKSQQGIEMARYDFGNGTLVWLSKWELLHDLAPAGSERLEILALPYPYRAVSEYLEILTKLNPKEIVIYNYPSTRSHVDLDFLSSELQRIGITMFDTQKHGAIRFRFGRRSFAITCVVPEG